MCSKMLEHVGKKCDMNIIKHLPNKYLEACSNKVVKWLQQFQHWIKWTIYLSLKKSPTSLILFSLSLAVPERPRGLALIVQNQTYIVLQWSPPEKVNGIIIDYQVAAWKLPATGVVKKWRTNDSRTEFRMPQLNTQATYKISVLAINRIGKGPPVLATFDLTAG